MAIGVLRALGVAFVLVACTTEVPETVPSGHVWQSAYQARYPIEPVRDVVLVVNAEKTGVGRALVEHVSKALEQRAPELAYGDAYWLRHLDNPTIDVACNVE